MMEESMKVYREGDTPHREVNDACKFYWIYVFSTLTHA